MVRTMKYNDIKKTEEWMDEIWCNYISLNRNPDKVYYNGAIRAIEMLGYDWRRDEEGHHTIF